MATVDEDRTVCDARISGDIPKKRQVTNGWPDPDASEDAATGAPSNHHPVRKGGSPCIGAMYHRRSDSGSGWKVR